MANETKFIPGDKVTIGNGKTVWEVESVEAWGVMVKSAKSRTFYNFDKNVRFHTPHFEPK